MESSKKMLDYECKHKEKADRTPDNQIINDLESMIPNLYYECKYACDGYRYTECYEPKLTLKYYKVEKC
jgi:hypothetical protein